MIARGDLEVDVPLENILILQEAHRMDRSPCRQACNSSYADA